MKCRQWLRAAGAVIAVGLAISSMHLAYAGAGGDDPNNYVVLGDNTPPGTPDRPLNPQEQATLDAKNKLSDEYALVRQGKANLATFQQHWLAFERRAGMPETTELRWRAFTGVHILDGRKLPDKPPNSL